MLLGQVGLPSKIPGMALWVPDWSHNKHAHRGGAMEQLHWGVSPNSSPIFRFDNQGRHLMLRGVIVDEIVDRPVFSLIHGHNNLGPLTEEWSLNEPLPPDVERFIQSDISHDIRLALRLWNIHVLRTFLDFVGYPKINDQEFEVLDHTFYGTCWKLRFLKEDREPLRQVYELLWNGQEPKNEANDISVLQPGLLLEHSNFASDQGKPQDVQAL